MEQIVALTIIAMIVAFIAVYLIKTVRDLRRK